MGNVAAGFVNSTNPSQKEHHGVLQKYSKNDMLQFIQTQNIEGILQKCKMYQKKDNEILFSIPVRKTEYQASQQFNQEIKLSFIDRVKLQHPNLISCIGLDAIQSQEKLELNNAEESGDLLNLMYEYNTFSLEALISERLDSNRLFPEDDLLNLAKSILNVLNYLQRQNIPHGDIHPASIFFNSSGNNFAIYDRDFLCGRCIGMRLAEGGKKFSYLSPEQITLMRSGSNVFTSNEMIYKSDIFSFGMTLLEAASLRLSQECYDENYSILAPVISERLQFIQNYYSSHFCSYLSLMLEYDIRKRLDPISLWNKLQRDGSFLFPTHVQNNIIANQQQQSLHNNNTQVNQSKNKPIFAMEQQIQNQIIPYQNQYQQQQQIQTCHQFPRSFQNQQSQQVDLSNDKQIINSGVQKNNHQDNDNKKYGKNEQQIFIQEGSHHIKTNIQNQFGMNNNQNNQQIIQLLNGNQIQNHSSQQQQNQIQFVQCDNQMKNSQIQQQQINLQNGIKQGIINNQQQKPIIQSEQYQQQIQYQQQLPQQQQLQQHEYSQQLQQQQVQQQQLQSQQILQQQQLQQQYQQQYLQQQQLQLQQPSQQQYLQQIQRNINNQITNQQSQPNNNMTINQLQSNPQQNYAVSHQYLDFTPSKDQTPSNTQNEQSTNEKNLLNRQQEIQQQKQFQHFVQQNNQSQQQIVQIQQNQHKFMNIANENNLNRESRSASNNSVSQERLYPQEINKTQTSFQYSPQFEQANQIEKSYQNEYDGSEFNNNHSNQRQDAERSLQSAQNRQHSKSLFNRATDDNSLKKEFNPSQILKNLQEQQSIIHAQFQQNINNEQYLNNQIPIQQQNQRQNINQPQLNQINYQQNYQNNQSNFETQDMELIAPENDPNTSSIMILQNQNFLKIKHPKQSSSSFHQNISQEQIDQQMDQSQIGKPFQKNAPNSYQLQKQQLIANQSKQAIQPSISPLRENNGKIISSNTFYQRQQNQIPYEQNLQKDYSLQLSNKNNQQQNSSNQRIFSQRSKSFIQPSQNQASVFNSPAVFPKHEVDENMNQNLSQQQQLMRHQEQYEQSLIRQEFSSPTSQANQPNFLYYNDEQIIGQQNIILPHPQVSTQIVYQQSPPQQELLNISQPKSLILQPSMQQNSVQHPVFQHQTQTKIQSVQNYNQKQLEQNNQEGEQQNVILLQTEQEQQFQNHFDNLQIQAQVISPRCFQKENREIKDLQLVSSEQQKRPIAQQQVYSQLPQSFYLSPITQKNVNNHSENQNPSQVFNSSNKNTFGSNTNYKNMINNSLNNQQSQSLVALDSSQYEIQQNLVNTSMQNYKKSGIYQNSNQGHIQNPYSILVQQDNQQSYKAQIQNNIKNKIPQNISYDNQKINNSNISQNQSQLSQNNAQDSAIDSNQQHLSPNAQQNQSALKLSLLLSSQQQNSSKIINSSKIQDSQPYQISSFQPNIDLNERVKQVIARSQAIRKTFE